MWLLRTLLSLIGLSIINYKMKVYQYLYSGKLLIHIDMVRDREKHSGCVIFTFFMINR